MPHSHNLQLFFYAIHAHLEAARLPAGSEAARRWWGGESRAAPRSEASAAEAIQDGAALPHRKLSPHPWWESEGNETLVEDARDSFLAPLLYWLRSQEPCAEARAISAGRAPQTPHPAAEALPPDRPDATLPALRELYYANAARKCALLGLLEELCGAFEARGIPFVLLKGAALEAALELPPALRVMADLDLLVPPERLLAAERLLIERGLVSTRDTLNTELLRQHGYHLAPYAAPNGPVVELHRAVLPRTAPFRLPAAEIWQESRQVVWRGHAVRVPSPSHLFLHTCIHSGYWHTHGVALRRLWDLGLIAGRMDLDRAVLARAAGHAGALRLVRARLEELDRLEKERAAGWPELGRRLTHDDDLWTDRTAAACMRARLHLLDGAQQRWSLLLHTLLPAWEETVNVTGCPTRTHHLGHFLHPRRLGRGITALLRR